MQRAKKIFTFEEYANGAPFVAKIWRTRSEPFDRFISVAATHWEMVVTRQRGRSLLTIRGPETKVSLCGIPQDAEFFGIEFAPGADAARSERNALLAGRRGVGDARL